MCNRCTPSHSTAPQTRTDRTHVYTHTAMCSTPISCCHCYDNPDRLRSPAIPYVCYGRSVYVCVRACVYVPQNYAEFYTPALLLYAHSNSSSSQRSPYQYLHIAPTPTAAAAVAALLCVKAGCQQTIAVQQQLLLQLTRSHSRLRARV